MNIFKTDVLVVGGGSAGIAASVAARKNHSSVILIEANEFLGGNATSSEVGTICGLYHQEKSSTSNYIVDGFTLSFVEKLSAFSNTKPISNREGLHFLPYQIECYKTICNHILENEKIDCFLSTKIVDISVSDSQARSCIVNYKDEVFEIQFNSIIDCSGQSIVSKLANLPLLESTTFQSSALVFAMKGVNIQEESTLNLVLIRQLSRGISQGIVPKELKNIFIVPGSLVNGNVSFKVSIPLKVTLTKNNLSELKSTGIKLIHSFIEYIISTSELFQHASLDHIAEEVGIRTGFRPIGNYTLTEEDIISCRKFETSIANCTWPIEDWNSESGLSVIYLPENDYYQIPKECLTSPHLTNLYFGGKNISATDRAIASARVMGICFQTGYAAGEMAAIQVSLEHREIILSEVL